MISKFWLKVENQSRDHHIHKTETRTVQHLQEPVNGQNQRDFIDWQTDRRQHNRHGNQSGLWDAGGANGGSCCCETKEG